MTTKVTIELKDGMDVALKRLHEVQRRRTIERAFIKNETDENDSGWSEEEYDTKPSYSTPAPISNDDFSFLFQAIGQLQGLRQLLVDYYVNPIPIKAFLQLFQQGTLCSRFEGVEFRHTTFTGEMKDFQELAKVLREQSVCVKVCMSSCTTPSMQMTDSLVDAFSSPSTLFELNLEEMNIAGESIARLCNLPSLTTLRLRHIPSCNQHMQLIAEALRPNRVIQTIQIRYAMDQDAAKAFFQMLEGNQSILAVDIDVHCWGAYGDNVGAALKINRTIQNLELNIFGEDDNVDANAQAITQSFAANMSLMRLCLTFHQPLQQEDDELASTAAFVDRLTCAFSEPFAKVMPNNLTLGQLLIGPIHMRVRLCDSVRFYLKLNHAGRRELVEPNEASRSQWVDTLIRHQDDLDVLFYFISLNPSLTECNHGQSDTILEPRYKRVKLD